MSKLAVIYWSGTGNTEAMAMAVGEGAKAAGAEVSVLTVSEISAAQAAQYDVLALGCPAMGAEVLEEGEFEPFFTELEGSLSGRKTALFGSYGWGDGQWMRDWCGRARSAGAVLCGAEGLMLNEAPDDAGLDACRALGASLAAL
ncbi:flavodoxin [Pseudoflavonifractor phocaeensis]|uniref:flavodoxin n=1 Tax=Pseudoflavonifractor phocaeensis TaxID=1870988 RepID=UPI0021097B34|nr:flavodoxin [Pseudoflavonifractor phocaeensis]MCQ4864875.1 flavodoxin [Pseudoflavonifractor phocaeensis]